MSDKLWYVEISGYIVAPNYPGAMHVAENRLVAVDGLDIKVVPAVNVDDSWRTGLPYGLDDDDERTCAEILAEQEEK